MDYSQAVTEFLHLDEEIQADQWRQAELTWEQLEAGVSAKQWARDIHKSDWHVRTLHGVWDAMSTSRLAATVSFNDAYQMIGNRKGTPEAAHAANAERRARSALGKVPPEKREEIERRVRQAELTARERDLAEQQDKDDILGSTEILAALASYRDRGDQFVDRWSRRKIRLAAAERGVFDSEVEALQRVVDQIRLLGEGRDSMEDELRRMAEGQKR